MSTLRKSPKHADLIYDVGLNTGQDTDYYLKKGYRVVAFEAEPRNVEYCRERFADTRRGGRGQSADPPFRLRRRSQVRLYGVRDRDRPRRA